MNFYIDRLLHNTDTIAVIGAGTILNCWFPGQLYLNGYSIDIVNHYGINHYTQWIVTKKNGLCMYKYK